MPTQPNYRPDIDGLRALAVAMVILYHAHVPHLAGFLGVDVFFVISGYVVTQSILPQIGGGTFSVRSFLLRRVRRLLPALLATILATSLVGAILFLPKDFLDLTQANLSQILLVSNLYFWKTGHFGYFGDPPELRPTLHFWSLSLEEQFYLFLPMFLVIVTAVSKTAGRRSGGLVLGSATAVLLLSLIHSVRSLPYSPFYVFYGLAPRVWEFMVGVVLAQLPEARSSRLKAAMSYLGLLAILLSAGLYQKWTPFPGLAALPPCLGTALIIAGCGRTRNGVSRLFSARPLVWAGRISYSLYLWHWPIFAFVTYLLGSSWTQNYLSLFGVLALVVGSSLASYHYLEQPIRRKELFKSNASLVGMILPIFILILVLFLWAKSTGGWPKRWSDSSLRFAKSAEDHQFRLDISNAEASLGRLGESDKVDYVLWGDSHAMALAPELDALSTELKMGGLQATRSGTPPLDTSESRPWYGQNPSILAGRVKATLAQRQVRNVILASTWNSCQEDRFRSCLSSTIQELRKSGAQCWVIGPIPQYEFDVARALALDNQFPGILNLPQSARQHRSIYRAFYATMEGLTSDPGVKLVDPAPALLENDGHYKLSDGRQSYYTDSNHLSLDGSRLLRPLLREMLESMQARQN